LGQRSWSCSSDGRFYRALACSRVTVGHRAADSTSTVALVIRQILKLVSRQLQADPVRTVLTSFALAAVIAVILIFEGFLEGVVEQSRDAVMNRRADLIATQSGIKNLTLARSVLPQSARSEVESVDGVIAAHPLTGIPVIYEQAGVRAPLLLLVYDTSGGPHEIVAGQPISDPRGIIVDLSFARKFDLAPGDPLVISDFEFTVSGITEGAAAFFSAFGFVRYDDLIDFYFESDLAADISTFPLLSFLLVDIADESSPADIAAEIERTVSSADVFLPTQIAGEDEALARTLLGPIIGLLVAAGYISGALVTGIIMFATVNSRRRSLGVLKALGFSGRYLAASVIAEALILIAYRVPVTVPAPLLRTAAAAIVFGIIGALMPVRSIRRLDPSVVFRS
jgi:putative ABC transport system permease protein